MKKFVFVLAFIALSAQAEVVITGGFGTDGASGESIPTELSVRDAAAFYRGLNVRADARDKKIISISDKSHIECSKPFKGIHRLDAGCQFTLRASQNGVIRRGQGAVRSVKFTGKLATKIFQALPADTSGGVGSSTKSVANVSCSKVVKTGVEATCTISDAMAISLDVDL